jgi:hypothetical protein
MPETYRKSRVEKFAHHLANEIRSYRKLAQSLQEMHHPGSNEIGEEFKRHANVLRNMLYDYCKIFELEIKDYIDD